MLTFATRWAFRSGYPTEWDSVQLAMGVRRFDVTDATPHAPGYWLYVAAGRAVHVFTGLDAQGSLVLLAALASAGAVAVAYLLGRDLGGRWLGLAAAAFLLTSPVLWYYGAMPATYDFDALTSLVLLLLAWRARPGSSHGVGAAVALGLGTGFRPTSLLVLGPIALVAAVRSVRTVVQAGAVAAAGTLSLAVWIVPMSLEQPGGYAAIGRANADQWASVAHRTSIVYDAPRAAVLTNAGQVAGYTLAAVQLLAFLGVLLWVVRLLWLRSRGEARAGTRLLRLTPARLLWVAVMPPLAFVLGFHFGKGGYVLSFLPALVLLLLLPAAGLPRRLRLAAGVVVALICLLNAQRFLSGAGIVPSALMNRGLPLTQPEYGAPYVATAGTIRQTDRETTEYLAIAKTFDPACDDLVYVWANGAHRFRHANLTMPQFTMDMIHDGYHEFRWQSMRRHEEYNGTIPIRHGGRAVLVLDGATPEVQTLVGAGQAQVVRLTGSDRVVWVVRPGRKLFGVDFVEAPAGPGPSCG